MLLLLIVAAPDVAPTQVAVMLFGNCALIVKRLMSAGSDVDHEPWKSATIGQVPETCEESKNLA